MTKRRTAAVLFLGAAAVFGWQQRSVYQVARQRLLARIQEARQKIVAEEAIAAQLFAFRSQVAQAEAELEMLKQQLPSFYELAWALNRLEACAWASRVAIRSLEVGEPTKRAGYHEVVVSVTAAGSDAAVDDWLQGFHHGHCRSDRDNPLFNPATGRATTRIIHVLGPVPSGPVTELGLVLFSTENPTTPTATPEASEAGPRLWIPSLTPEIGRLETELSIAQRRLQELQVIGKQIDELVAKRRRRGELQALVERLKAAEPGLAQGRALLADTHWRAGRFAKAAACYRAALPAPDGLVADTGFFQAGRVHVREPGPGDPGQTAHLLVLDPANGQVTVREVLPGFVREFVRQGDGVTIHFTAGAAGAPAAARYGPSGFDRVPPLPEAFAPRRSSRRLSMMLASGFLNEVLPNDTIGGLARIPSGRRFGIPPRSFGEIEAGLREAALVDPTNPWHTFLLGAAAQLQGREPDASSSWRTLFENGFARAPYYEYSQMADLWERLGQRSWADRAYAEALRRRRLVPRPIDVTGALGRAANAPFPEGGDDARTFVWHVRERELTGILLPDEDLSARAWASYWRKRGDVAKAAEEEAFAARAARHPLNPKPATAVFEGAFCLSAGALAGFWAATIAHVRRRGGGRGVVLAAAVALLAVAAYYVWSADRLLALRAMHEPWGDTPVSYAERDPSPLTRWAGMPSLLASLPVGSTSDLGPRLARFWSVLALQAALVLSCPVAVLSLFFAATRRLDGPTATPPPGIDRTSRLAFLLVPGLLDVTRGALGRAYAAMGTFVMAATAALFLDVDAPASGLAAPRLSATAGWSQSLSLPPGGGDRLQHWTLVGSLPATRWLWAAIGLAAAICVALHVARLPLVWRLPHVAIEPGSRTLPRWLRVSGAILLWAQALGLIALVAAAKVARVWPNRWEPLFIGGGIAFVVAAVLPLLYLPVALGYLILRRGVRPGPREAAQILVLGAEAALVGWLWLQ